MHSTIRRGNVLDFVQLLSPYIVENMYSEIRN